MSQATGQITIYQTDDGQTQINVRMEQDSVWLRQDQMSELFGRERSVVTKHLRNIFAEGELEADSVCANFAHTAEDGKTYQVTHYNLDVAISVGYRVKSIAGTRFRQWATQRLRQHLVEGYTLNQQRLEARQEKLSELKQAIVLSARLIHNKNLSHSESQGILSILEKYSHALTVLDDYDHQRLQVVGTRTLAHPKITYDEAIQQIRLWRNLENLGGLFGNEKDDSFQSSLETIYQTFDGKELYPSI